MERYWLETGTKLHKTYDSARNYGSDYSAPDGRHEVVFYADAQATIAALQARVKELEAIKIPDDAFTYCAYCGEKSPVDEHNEDLAAHIKVCPKHPMRDVESQLTQRTAELEALRPLYDDMWKQFAESQAELERVMALIKALPKVGGEVTVRDVTALCWANDGTYGSINCKEQLVSLLQERQKLC